MEKTTNKFRSKIALILFLKKMKVTKQSFSLYEVRLPVVDLGFMAGDYLDLDD